MMGMIEIEMQEIENIQKELNGGAINLDDIENRWDSNCHPLKTVFYYFCFVFRLQEEDDEVSQLTIEELKATTETPYTGNLPLLGG